VIFTYSETMNYTCTFCGKTYVKKGNFENHKQLCQPMKYQQLEKENQMLRAENERLRQKLEDAQTVNYNNFTFNLITTKDAIQTIHETFDYFIQAVKPFIKTHAKDADVQQKLIVWGKENADPKIQQVITDVVEQRLPVDKTHFIGGQLENKEEVEKCYLEEKENLLKRLNEILQIENLPEYDDLIEETDQLLNL